MQAQRRRRARAERRFRRAGQLAIGVAIAGLVVLLGSIVANGFGAFRGSEIRLDVHFDPEAFGEYRETAAPAERSRALARADYGALVKRALRGLFPEVEERRDQRALARLVSLGARAELREAVEARPSLIGTTASLWLPADDVVDGAL
jgi:phosphate transport system permease protein